MEMPAKNSFLPIAAFLALYCVQLAFGQTPRVVANGASLVVDEVAPGSIAVIFGTNLSGGTARAANRPWPTTLANTTVYCRGTAVPLYYVSPTRIDFQVPNNALAGLPTNISSVNVVVRGSSEPTLLTNFAVSTAAPGIFVHSNGWAVVQNQDDSRNTGTNPAAAGSNVTAYMTGIGPVDNPVTEGVAAPGPPFSQATLPFSATIGGVSANVVFLGLAPGEVGVAQANIQIPDIAPGTYPLAITVGGAVSNTGLITVSGGTLIPQYALASVMGDGVSGSPAIASPSYDAGSVAPYSYAPASGFSAAVVEVDGTLSPPGGSVTMNADHWLWAFGQPLTGTDFAGYITVPNDPAVIPYPQFYANQPSSLTVRVADPYCAIQSRVVTYPRRFLGDFPMPAVTGAPLRSSILRGVELKDYWFVQNSPGTGNPSRNAGCSSGGTMHDALTESVARAKHLGADHVSVVNIAVVVDAKSATPVIDALHPGQGLPESELAFIAKTANLSGMDLWLDFQVSSEDEQNTALNTSPTTQWMSVFLDGWTDYVVQQAKLAQKYGVKSIMINWGDFHVNITPYRDIYVAKLTAALSQVRNVFQGTVRVYNIAPTPVDPDVYGALYNGVDVIQFYLYSPLLTSDENQNLSFALVKRKFKDMLGNIANGFAPFSKPLDLYALIQSHRNFLQTGWIEDTPVNCANGCIETALQTDFSVQAIAYEALLEVAMESGLDFASFDTMGYWWTDTILPEDTFPNIAQSVRNKPAEAILQRWFAK